MRHVNQIEPYLVDSSQFRPLADQMLVRYEEESESSGGIVYVHAENTWWAGVFATGPDCTVSVGERVLMEQFRGDNIDFSDGEFTIVSEKDALAAW